MLTVAILAGGLATRLRPLTTMTPKSLIEVNGEPFIVHQLRLLRVNGARRVVLCVGHLGEMIEEIVADGAAFGLEVSYSYDGDSLLGTGGAIKKALPLLEESFFVAYGDSYLPCNYEAVAASFEKAKKQALMTVFWNKNRWDTSNVEFNGHDIIAYDKRSRSPRMQFIDYGLGVFRAEALAAVRNDPPFDLADVYRDLLTRGELAGFEVRQRFYEIGSKDGLNETAAYLARAARR